MNSYFKLKAYNDKDKKIFSSIILDINNQIQNIKKQYFGKLPNIPPVELILVSSRKKWTELFAGKAYSEWGGGLTKVNENKIYLLLEQESWPDIQKTLIHEWIHIALHAKYNNFRIPLWFEEGLAQYLSGENLQINDYAYLSNVILVNKLLSFQEIENINEMPEKRARLAYIESYLAIYYFNIILGDKKLQMLLNQNPIGFDNFSDYFYSTCGFSVDAYESKFLALIKNKYKWQIFLNLESFLFLIALLLLFGSYFIIRRQNKKRIQEMEDFYVEDE